MGIGRASGESRGVNAARTAISSPLLEDSIDGARGVLLSISGGEELGLFEVNEAAEVIHDVAHPEANIIFGTVIDPELGDEIRVTVIAAGFDRFDNDGATDVNTSTGDAAPESDAEPQADPSGESAPAPEIDLREGAPEPVDEAPAVATANDDDDEFDVPSFLR